MPLDLLIVGGGPGGTAAAFRGRELGLDVLVVDFDDLMRRIRDYSKDKLILPGFGGGDRMAFPAGGDLVDALRFAAVDKDELCRTWKGLYEEHEVPFRVGLELTGLERRDGLWEACLWDQKEHAETTLATRAVVLALGRGCPRRFDIPGDTRGIAFRLEDPASYAGRPACVVGGGTSAAEAVIAISNAKAAADDQTAVYWSYRGVRLPRVSKALAEVFFEAYAGNGNIRYFPGSEPVAVVVNDDHEEVLSIRTDRRSMPGRPPETIHLEFPKTSVVACIGEDLPAALLASLGVPLVTGGPKDQRRLAVTRHLESVHQEGVYLVGDLLSPAYFETEAVDAELGEVRHRGNIKAALRDGVLVAEVVRRRLHGESVDDVTVGDAEDLEPPPDLALRTAPAPPAATRPSTATRTSANLIRLLPGGVEGEETPLREEGVLTVGRHGCDLSFPDDTSLSAQHASLVHDGEGYMLRDEGSAAGVFLQVPSADWLAVEPGDLLAAGRQFLLLGGTLGAFELTCYDATGRETGRLPLSGQTVILGRQAPDALLDPKDKTLSRRQLALRTEGGDGGGTKILVKDLKSVNGTYLRLQGPRRLEHGQQFRVGQQRFLLSLREDPALLGGAATAPPAAVSPAAVSPAAVSPAAASCTVTFEPGGKTCPASPGQTLCEVAEQHGVALNAECHSGICGSDPIRIVRGGENLDLPGDQEAATLADLCDLEAPGCRLACMARIRGPVTVEILIPEK